MRSGKVLLGVLAGVATGAVIGILFASDKGTNTRKKIFKYGDNYVAELKSRFDDFLDTITEKYESAKGDANNLIEKGKSRTEQVKDDVKNAVHEKVSYR
ncbi:MAG: YtxH domain-containing protein [Saprospiraceae bacterium]